MTIHDPLISRQAAEKATRGMLAYQAGQSAEQGVERHYLARGGVTLARRWRGKAGEIDLIMDDGDGLVFVEVKKSRSHARAAQDVSRRQMERLCLASQEFMDANSYSALTNMRFDVALMDGQGHIDVIENAFGA
ncbi:MAG: YraN family protein [Pseudomonadota bacterium]|nr:YraN family protein [Pseudomonadota bacterium]